MIDWSGTNHPRVPLFLTLPHSGETIPPEANWLSGFPKPVLLTDVDRFVDRLYAPAITKLPLPALSTQVHRYAADLNRYPEDIDTDSVQGATKPAGSFTRGFHWVETTQGNRLIKHPIEAKLHDEIVRQYHDVFHQKIGQKVDELKKAFPGQTIYHLDCHSMPSVGGAAHKDGGSVRADVVISDFEGKSASERFKDFVMIAFKAQGFEVSYNWPYQGGRITQRYGRPSEGHETVQIELNRALYMNEKTRDPLPARFDELSSKLLGALTAIIGELAS